MTRASLPTSAELHVAIGRRRHRARPNTAWTSHPRMLSPQPRSPCTVLTMASPCLMSRLRWPTFSTVASPCSTLRREGPATSWTLASPKREETVGAGRHRRHSRRRDGPRPGRRRTRAGRDGLVETATSAAATSDTSTAPWSLSPSPPVPGGTLASKSVSKPTMLSALSSSRLVPSRRVIPSSPTPGGSSPRTHRASASPEEHHLAEPDLGVARAYLRPPSTTPNRSDLNRSGEGSLLPVTRCLRLPEGQTPTPPRR